MPAFLNMTANLLISCGAFVLSTAFLKVIWNASLGSKYGQVSLSDALTARAFLTACICLQHFETTVRFSRFQSHKTP